MSRGEDKLANNLLDTNKEMSVVMIIWINLIDFVSLDYQPKTNFSTCQIMRIHLIAIMHTEKKWDTFKIKDMGENYELFMTYLKPFERSACYYKLNP